MLTGGEGIRWEPSHGARIGLLDRGAPGDTTTWIDVEPFWVFHFLNAFDDGDAVVVDGCRADRLNVAFGDAELSAPARPVLHRWRIEPGSGRVTTERLGERTADFPRVDDRRACHDARYGYVGRGADRADDGGEEISFDGVVKHDLHARTATSMVYGPGIVSGEPVLAADPGSDVEDAGWVLNWVHDRAADESAVIVLDAGTLDEVARVHLPRRVPFGFHGVFLPGAE
jgi:carotenoid cleavage dioxygenase